MNGLYNNLTSNSLYGKNLSYELIDVISKRYAPLAKSTYLTSLNSWGYACLLYTSPSPRDTR